MRIEELRTPLVAPSILARKGEGLLPAALSLKGQGIEVLHFDFMRPPYVGGEGLSFEDFSLIHGRTGLFEDVHVMSGTPLEDGKFFLENGADAVTVHGDSGKEDEIHGLFAIAHSLHKAAGISISPHVPLSTIFPFLDEVELVLVMGVVPGACGKSFDPRGEEHLLEISTIRDDFIRKGKKGFLISFDGSVNGENGRRLVEEGADILVTGSYYFNGDPRERLASLLGR